jgi:hypothetical protein
VFVTETHTISDLKFRSQLSTTNLRGIFVDAGAVARRFFSDAPFY